MSERQGNIIIALLCLNFAYDAVKLMITMYYDREDRIELNYRLDRLEEFLVRKTVVQCSCDCCDCCEEDEDAEDAEDTEEAEEAEEAEDAEDAEEAEEGEEGEEDTQEDEEETQDAEEETQDADEETQDAEEETQDAEEEEEGETFISNDGGVYKFKINLDTVQEIRTVEKMAEEAPPTQ
jgi:hypothetical protein